MDTNVIVLQGSTMETITRYLAAIFGIDDRTHPGGWVLCFKDRKKLARGLWTVDKVNCNQGDLVWVPRTLAEVEPEAPQIIPYCFIIDAEGNTLVYERAGTEKRLHGLTSVGWGGHISLYEDQGSSFKELIQSCIYRELKEELGIEDKGLLNAVPAYLYYDDSNDTNAVHYCIAYIVSYLGSLRVHRNDESKNILKVPVRELMEEVDSGNLDRFESWSKTMLDHLRLHIFTKTDEMIIKEP